MDLGITGGQEVCSLNSLLSSGAVGALLTAAAARPDLVRAHEHPNGFGRIQLAEFPDGSRLRLHSWAGDTCEGLDVHNHRWNFGSLLLSGRLVQSVWREGGHGRTLRRYRVTHAFDGSGYSSRQLESARMTVVREDEFRIGDRYELAAHDFHTVQATGPTTTLVLHSPKVAESTTVMTNEGFWDELEMSRMDSEVVLREIRFALARLSELAVVS